METYGKKEVTKDRRLDHKAEHAKYQESIKQQKRELQKGQIILKWIILCMLVIFGMILPKDIGAHVWENYPIQDIP